MRLTQIQIEIMKRSAKEIFGPETGLILFGSRVNDCLSGGDIDLYVTVRSLTIPNSYAVISP